MKECENGWNLKTKGYMTSEPSYQKIMPKEACDAIELGRVIMFVKVDDGSETESRAYVPKEHIKELQNECESERDYANQMEAIADRLRAENAKLRKLVLEYAKIASYLSRDFNYKLHELGIEVD